MQEEVVIAMDVVKAGVAVDAVRLACYRELALHQSADLIPHVEGHFARKLAVRSYLALR